MDQPRLSFEIAFSAFAPFLDYWASRYRYEEHDKSFYDPYIGKADLQTNFEALEALFKWKNGGAIANQKLRSICTNYEHWIEDANLEARYLDPHQGGGPIWNIFYLHCRQPGRYPIFDQHTHRAMLYIQRRAMSDTLSGTTLAGKKHVYEAYKQYRDFVAEIGGDLRKIDRAIYTFGQFLKVTKPYCDC